MVVETFVGIGTARCDLQRTAVGLDIRAMPGPAKLARRPGTRRPGYANVRAMLTSDLTEARGRSFAADRALLAGVLAEVVGRAAGPRALELHEEAVTLARAAREGDGSAAERLAALVARLGAGEAEILVRSLTRWFQLMNLAEDNERIRRVRAREPARGAVQRLLADGTGAP